MSNQATPKENQTVLPYTLGGKDDPHFQDLSSKDVDVAIPATGLPSRVDALPAQPYPTIEEQLAYWTNRDCELIAGRIFKPWYEREDWEVPGNGGTNDHLFEDNGEDL